MRHEADTSNAPGPADRPSKPSLSKVSLGYTSRGIWANANGCDPRIDQVPGSDGTPGPSPTVKGTSAGADGDTAVSGLRTLVGILVFLLPLLL